MNKPNVIFVLTDDQAQWAVGAYGNEDIHTPNMDRLAEEGMLFSQAFTAPVCSPSRAMIMTGLYAHQVGIDDWISPDEDEGLDPRATTLAEVFKRAGYITALIGKWHLGHRREEFHPLRRGFDYFMGFLGGGNRPMNPTLIVEGEERQLKGYLTDILTDEAIKFIREHRDKPFALFLHTRAPHAPYTPVPEEDMAHYIGKTFKTPKVEGVPDERVQEEYRGYYASVSSIDRNLGKLLEELDSLRLSENTIVILMGDNGYMIGHHGLLSKGNAFVMGKRGRRRPNMFELSILVPLIIRWPAVIRPGSKCDEMVCSIDFMPTFIDILRECGCDVPELKTEGMSMLPLFKGENVEWREELFLIYDMHHGAEAHMRMIRTRKWKLVLHYEEGGQHELYDLEEDPTEERNLYGGEKVAEVQKRLNERLVRWQRRLSDPFAPKEG